MVHSVMEGSGISNLNSRGRSSQRHIKLVCLKRIPLKVDSLKNKSINYIDSILCMIFTQNGKWFWSLSHLSGLIVRVRVVPRRTVVGDIDRGFGNLSGSHRQSHVNSVSSVYRQGSNKCVSLCFLPCLMQN